MWNLSQKYHVSAQGHRAPEEHRDYSERSDDCSWRSADEASVTQVSPTLVVAALRYHSHRHEVLWEADILREKKRLWVFPRDLSPVDRMICRRFGRQHINRIPYAQRRRNENMINAVFAGRSHSIGADLSWVNITPGFDVNTIDQLIPFFIGPQVIVAK